MSAEFTPPVHTTAPAPARQAPWHVRWLRERGLDPTWCVIEPASAFTPDAPFTLVSHALEGHALLEQSYRVHDPDNPATPRDEKGKPRKYEAPPRSGSVVYAPLPHSRKQFRDAHVKYIAEGHGKTIALAGLGLPVLGIAGIQNWHRKGETALLPDLAALIGPGDQVIAVPDGDFHTNTGVASGLHGHLNALRAVGATPGVIDLHDEPLQKIDDLLAHRRWQGRDVLAEFHKLPRLSSLAPPVEIQSLPHDFALNAPPPALAVVAGLLPCRSGVLFAPGRERKTTFTLYMAAHVALGRQLFGKSVALPGRVLYVTGEDDAEDVWRTLHYMIQAGALPLTADEAAELRDSLRIVDATTLPGAPRLTRKENGAWQASELLSVVDQALATVGDVVLCILDTLSSLGLSETEGMNEAAAAYHREAARLSKQHQLCVLALHHVGKAFAQERSVDMYGGRGASAIVDNARFALQLQLDKGEPEYVAPPAISRAERDGKVPGTHALRLHVHKMRWDDGGASTERPLWVRSTGWKYETFAALDVVQSAAELQKAQAQERSDTRSADDDVLLNAMRGLERDGIVIDRDQVMTLKVLPERRTKAALARGCRWSRDDQEG
jgi:hypothetical protein